MQQQLNELLEGGIIVIDKPVGPTSFDTVDFVRQILRIEKAGHSGTLDPKVSGVLPIALNRSTRVLELMLVLPKEYVGVMRLHSDVSIEEIREKIKERFSGKISQLPPRKSAVKRQEREREVYEFELLEKEGPDVLFRVKCEAGTYVRKLVHDLGLALGITAHMSELRRTAVGNFSEKSCITLYELSNAYEEAEGGKVEELKKVILPAELAAAHLPKAMMKKDALAKARHGKFLVRKDFLTLEKTEKINPLSQSAHRQEYIAGFFEKKLVCLLRSVQRDGVKLFKPDKVFI
ncbi:MAG TPA: RNA-guided pseudouridylation complex pseudouridine synthase subunit Cbf5 [Nanoarchaeota archaeon]|nr:MAG: H/ACA ribonucleoprotein complex subunit 4 [archaeon GW2011_AR6]MBS3083160.1 RNA-guided pseudouridylation complex pseudouridine synthase subunit Cbf5 [Candidatus Pacearchaeota archaeon]HIH18264.1 RNA-guided pseudouridylation complex pseudouridine synthase subunit Cbf5 [Nanoarchaeota archaeon]HIH34279.1 RNA-guided pseudouridylation complex pseudouridine synthase subunit Cbf5 [Nanoarchaeota archaeon]HIH50862.1 RNA-guided pseudouridylation complex pseudouridine synthase subunit Cbf5 [Nanoar